MSSREMAEAFDQRLSQRNRLVARLLVGWIVAMATISILVIVFK